MSAADPSNTTVAAGDTQDTLSPRSTGRNRLEPVALNTSYPLPTPVPLITGIAPAPPIGADKVSEEVFIGDLDKLRVLRSLYEHTCVAKVFSLPGIPKPAWNTTIARGALSGYIDYLFGRPIKMDLSAPYINPWLYDRDTYTGCASVAVACVRTNIDTHADFWDSDSDRKHKPTKYDSEDGRIRRGLAVPVKLLPQAK